MLDQNQRIFAEFFRTSSPWNLRTFNRTSGLQDSLALGLQKLQVFRCWRRSSELLSSESSPLDQKHNLQKLGLFIRTSYLRVFSLAFGQIIRAFRRRSEEHTSEL